MQLGVAPRRILPGLPHDQRFQFCGDCRPANTAARDERPCTTHELTMPFQHSLGLEDEHTLVQSGVGAPASSGQRRAIKYSYARVGKRSCDQTLHAVCSSWQACWQGTGNRTCHAGMLRLGRSFRTLQALDSHDVDEMQEV